jgi:hypothetical protein
MANLHRRPAKAGRDLLPSMARKTQHYTYDNNTRFTVIPDTPTPDTMTPDTILPHPHSMSLAATIFEGPSESRQELKATTPLTARNSKKNLPLSEFQIHQRRGCFRALAQDFDSMGDSQIRDRKVAYAKGGVRAFEQINPHGADSTWTPSPPPRMRDNPFRARRLFWSPNQGSPLGLDTDQIKVATESHGLSESTTTNVFGRSK